MNNKSILITIILALIIGAGVGYALFTYKASTTQLQSPVIPEKNDDSGQPQTTQTKYRYEIYPDKDRYDLPVEVRSDGKIIQIDTETNQKTTIVPSLKTAYPNATLWKLVFPDNSDQLYLTEVLLDTDAPLSDIIKYDAITNKFTQLKVGRYYQGFGPKAAAPSAPFVISGYNPDNENDERSLFLLNLTSDTAKLLLKLPNNQTFNQCADNNCFSGYIGEVNSLDNQTIEVSIYDSTQTDQDENGNLYHKLIEKRKIKIN